MTRHIRLIAMLCLPLALTACGEGWEMQLSNTVFPYGNQRTAGSGVVYVRAKMLPEKDVKLEPAATAEAPAAEVKVEEAAPAATPEQKEEKALEELRDMFRKRQQK